MNEALSSGIIRKEILKLNDIYLLANKNTMYNLFKNNNLLITKKNWKKYFN